MSGTTFPSNPCYIPIFEPEVINSSVKFTRAWRNFIHDLAVQFPSGWNNPAQERIKEWNGRLINDVVVFDTEQDKMWFILRWS